MNEVRKAQLLRNGGIGLGDAGDIDDALEETAEEGAPGRAMRVAHRLQTLAGDEFAKPGQLVEVKFVKGQSLSLTAARLLALMILTAGGDAWRPIAHRMRKAEIRRGHKGNERIADMLEELHRTLFAIDDLSWRGRKATKRFPLIQSSREEVEEDGGETGWIEWEFTPDARRMIRESETYAVLNRQAILGFRSAYALRLYEMGALRIHRRQSTWRGDMTALRAAFGIAPDLYKDFAQLRRKVLDKAKAEIDQLAHFTVDWREIRRGRAVVEVELVFHPKSAPAQLAATIENERHAAGRRARREGAVEVVAPVPPPAFRILPATPTPAPSASSARFPEGSLRYAAEPYAEIARTHGGGWDIDMIAHAYREQMGARLAGLSGAKLARSWTGFCQAYAARRGRP